MESVASQDSTKGQNSAKRRSWADVVKNREEVLIVPGKIGSHSCMCRGEFLIMLGHYGWIRSLEEIDHPNAGLHGGRIYVRASDISAGCKLQPGAEVSFFLYEDGNGLAAECCQLVRDSRPRGISAQPSPSKSLLKARGWCDPGWICKQQPQLWWSSAQHTKMRADAQEFTKMRADAQEFVPGAAPTSRPMNPFAKPFHVASNGNQCAASSDTSSDDDSSDDDSTALREELRQRSLDRSLPWVQLSNQSSSTTFTTSGIESWHGPNKWGREQTVQFVHCLQEQIFQDVSTSEGESTDSEDSFETDDVALCRLIGPPPGLGLPQRINAPPAGIEPPPGLEHVF